MSKLLVERCCTLVLLFLTATPVLTGSGCTDDPDADLVDAEGGSDPLSGKTAEFFDSAVVIDFNQIAVNAAIAHDNFDDFSVNLRGIAMMHLAMHDALNAIVPVYEQYALDARRPFAHPTAAAAQAARDVLVNIYPDQQAVFDAELAERLDGIAAGFRKSQGIQLGHDAAAAIIEDRQGDAMDVFGEYTPGSAPGDYQFVPPFDFLFRPAFGESRPFGLNSGEQFRPPPPPALTSSQYAQAYNEVKAFGILNGSSRSDDQTHRALWWFEPSEFSWNRITNLLARQRSVKLFPAARMFALVNMGIMDSYVAVWDAKQFYDFWRPFTAIRAGDTDGNGQTAPDPTWEALCFTPPIQEYPSAHAEQSAAAAEMLAAALGTDRVSFTVESTTAPPGQPTRSFTSLRAAGAEAADSRVMCGIHFRFATNAGNAAGRQVARFILDRELERRF